MRISKAPTNEALSMPFLSKKPISHFRQTRNISKQSFKTSSTISPFLARFVVRSPLPPAVIRTGLGHPAADAKNGVNNNKVGSILIQRNALTHGSSYFLNLNGPRVFSTRRQFSSESKVATMSANKDIATLAEEVRKVLPERFRDDAWYLIVVSTLVACNKPEEIGPLYTYITESSGTALNYEAQKRVKARLSDLLMKEWTLVGIPVVVIAITALAKVEKGVKEEDVKVPEKRKSIDINSAIPERGTKFLQAVYKENLAPIFASWGSYGPDFEWMEKAVIYGLFLSDHEILSPVETELVCVSAIMCGGWRAPTIWHLRGLRRMGVSEADVEMVQQAIEIVAKWSGKDVTGWPRVKDVPDVIDD
ncbi:hypothetical protein DTO169E5_6176 [Paecilomyces variotii]|nr:hypothetical protein DTO169E5_6176 [Paecilomyces variotii]